MNPFDDISAHIKSFGNSDQQLHRFYHYEPWDVERRPQWVLDQMVKDGVDIYSDEMLTHCGRDPHPFQTGYFMSNAFTRVILAGNQVGKSLNDLVETVIMLTAEIPISLKHEKGFDTGVIRVVNKENILRWGRRDTADGRIIDYDWTKEVDPSWNCGTIIGVGKFPVHKIAPPGEEIWICTFQKQFESFWWPRFQAGNKKCIIPENLIDKARANDGYNHTLRTVNFGRNQLVRFITYDSGFTGLEGEKAWKVSLDEEPPDRDIVASAMGHTKLGISFIETPYRGLTYTKELFFPRAKSKNVDVFHATQYDSPYQNKDTIAIIRDAYKPWEIASRIWGLHADVKGDPYFDYVKIKGWYDKYNINYKPSMIHPTKMYFDMIDQPKISVHPGLLNVPIVMSPMQELNKTNVWKVYEDVLPNVAYFLAADPSEGGDTPDESADFSAAMVLREPTGKENPLRPRVVATLRSTLRVPEFAKTCAYAAFYYNCALMVAETKRCAANGMFAGEIRNYPWWYRFQSVRDKDQMPQESIGWDTNAATRSAIFDLIGSWINSFDADEYPDIPDKEILQELFECIIGENNRPDHSKSGYLDLTLCLGMGSYVFKYSRDQIVCNRKQDDDKEERRRKWDLERHGKKVEKIACGMSGIGYRN